jgi:spermidine/putrescine transport system permease protein
VRLARGRRPRGPRGRGRMARMGLLGPALLWWTLFLALPLGLVVVTSFLARGDFGGIVVEVSLDNYRRALDPLYVRVLWFSVRVSALTTAIALAVGYPMAYFIATRPPRWRLVLLVLVVLPFWTNFLIRTYAWMVLLNRQGPVNRLLEASGVVNEPLTLLNNEFAIVVGLTYAYLPLMVLPIFASLERLDARVIEAAQDLGSSRVVTFLTVTLPLTVPGVVAGCLFVFVPSFGNYIVPQLLGGGRRAMIGNLIEQQFLSARDWPFGSVLALAVMAVMMLLVFAQGVVVSREKRS